MKIDLIPYDPIHCYEILTYNARRENRPIGSNDWEKTAQAWHRGGPAYTLKISNRIVGSGGLVCMDAHKAEAWLMLSTLFYKHKHIAIRTLLRKFDELIDEYQFKRIQALVPPGFTEGQRFIEWLGFEKEGTLRKFSHENEDMIMFAKIIENGRSG
jgi:RimJ/RimL family protein N-acetyltransferase